VFRGKNCRSYSQEQKRGNMQNRILGIIFFFLSVCGAAQAQIPQLINYQGRMTVGGTNFTGTGQFQFAFVNGGATQTFWSNGTGTVAVPVTKGLYAVLLGDTGMNPLPSSVFTNSDVRLRVWFNDGVTGTQLLSPDSRITSSGYAFMAGNVPDGLITNSKLADNAVTGAKLAAGAVGTSQLASSLSNSIVPWQINGGLAPSASANTGTILTNATLTELVLPSTATVGDVVRVSGVGTGGWQIAPNTGQSINGYSASFTYGATWTARASGGEAFYGLAMDYDGSTIIGVASYGGQIWISHDYGTNWMTKGAVSSWVAAASSYDGSKLAVILQGSQIYTSTDGGTNWTAQGSSRNWNGIASSADGNRLAAIVSGGQIYTSTNSGVDWVAREQNRSWAGIASSADGLKLAATVSGGQIYTSTDGGSNWTARVTNQNWGAIASSTDGTKLFTTISGGYFYTSNDSGVTWTQCGFPGNWAYLASSGDGNRLIANLHGETGYLYVSIDGGATWNQKSIGCYWRQVGVSGNGKVLAAASDRDGGIFISGEVLTGTTVSGAQGTTAALQYMGNNVWQPLNEGLIAAGAVGSAQLAPNLTVSGSLTANTLAGSFSGNGAGLTNIPGQFRWTVVSGTNQQALANNGYLLTNSAQTLVTLPASPTIGDTLRISGAGAGGWKLAQNSGQSILNLYGQSMAGWMPCENNRQWYAIASSADGTKLVGVVYNGQIYTSTNSGASWTPCESNRQWYAVASSADGTKLAGVVYNGQIYTSTNSGANWTPREFTRNWTSIASSEDGTKLAAAGDGVSIFTSTNSGANWTARISALNWSSVASSADGTKIAATLYGGAICTSTNSGLNWIASGSETTNWTCVASSADGSKLVATVLGGQIYTSINSGTTWTPREINRDWNWVASSADGSVLAATVQNGQVYISTDSGVTWLPRESSRAWTGVAVSGNGRKIITITWGGQIYIYTFGYSTPGADGYLTGSQGCALELQYIGNGQWIPLSHEGSITAF
jgi:hypothetical protein